MTWSYYYLSQEFLGWSTEGTSEWGQRGLSGAPRADIVRVRHAKGGGTAGGGGNRESYTGFLRKVVTLAQRKGWSSVPTRARECVLRVVGSLRPILNSEGMLTVILYRVSPVFANNLRFTGIASRLHSSDRKCSICSYQFDS